MRPSDVQIRAGLTHAELVVRQHAFRYFSEAFNADPQVMPEVIRAIEKFGWDEAFLYFDPMRDLVQSEATVRWLLDEVQRIGEPANDKEADRKVRLGNALALADVDLLWQHESELRGDSDLVADCTRAIAERLDLAREPVEQVWQKLEAWAEREKDHQYVNEMDLPHACRLAEAIAREPAFADRALDWAAMDGADESDPTASLKEGMGIRLLGLMRVNDAIPLFVEKLRIDTDWMREESVDALVRIGNDEVVDQLSRLFPDSEWHCRLYATGALDRLRTASACDRCLELVESEPADDFQSNLISVLLNNFDSRGIEPARRFGGELRAPTVAVSLLNDEPFPERTAWLAKERAHLKHQQRMNEVFTGGASVLPEAEPEPAPDFDDLAPIPPIVRGKKTGRNEPCPCGSGKKYKKCCLPLEVNA